MDITCPNCGRDSMFDSEFTSFEDCGDYIKATATHICSECDEAMTVCTTFVWNEEVEVY